MNGSSELMTGHWDLIYEGFVRHYVSWLFLGVLIGLIPAVVGTLKKQVRLGIKGLLACVLSSLLFPGLVPAIVVCVVFIFCYQHQCYLIPLPAQKYL